MCAGNELGSDVSWLMDVSVVIKAQLLKSTLE